MVNMLEGYAKVGVDIGFTFGNIPGFSPPPPLPTECGYDGVSKYNGLNNQFITLH